MNIHMLPAMPNPHKDLRRLSRAAGCALLAVSALQLLPALWLRGRSLENLHAYAMVSLLTALCALLPGAALGLLLLPRGQRKSALPLGRAKAKSAPLAVMCAGAAVCYWANMASAFVSALGEKAGVEFKGPPEIVPKNGGELLLMLLTIGLLPAVSEELLMRGVILQPLRRFGGGYAAVCSALLFALLHQNMQQAPMAFVSGLALAYAVLRCESLWPPAAIHFWNNAASVLLLYCAGRLDEQAMGTLGLLYGAALSLAGAVSLVVLVLRRERCGFFPAQPRPRLWRYFLGSVPMVLALLWFAANIVAATSFSQ